MKFKTEREQDQFGEISLILQIIASELDVIIQDLHKEMTVTRIYDAFSGESGVHLDKRALDVRDEYAGVRTFTDEEISTILRKINEKWKRNDGKNTLIHHSFQGGPFHFHLQIPLSTKVYEKLK